MVDEQRILHELGVYMAPLARCPDQCCFRPGTDGHVEGSRSVEHGAHVDDLRGIPGADVLVEVLQVFKEATPQKCFKASRHQTIQNQVVGSRNFWKNPCAQQMVGVQRFRHASSEFNLRPVRRIHPDQLPRGLGPKRHPFGSKTWPKCPTPHGYG